MRHSARWALVVVGILAVGAGPARAQYGRWGYGYYGWGGWGGASTPVGDIARGMGAFAYGAGQYNAATAVANSINADTMMRWNQYLGASAVAVRREELLHKMGRRELNNRAIQEIEARLRNNPTDVDIERGDALNAILDQLSEPRIHPSALKMSKIPLDKALIREIPFRYASEPIAFSMQQLTAEDGWPVPLQGQAFAAGRAAYQEAIEAALKEDLEQDLEPATIARVRSAITALRAQAEATIPKSDPAYLQAENFLKTLTGMARMLERSEVDKVLALLEKYEGTTVADLLGFMHLFNLRFGAARTAEQRAAYETLYPLLARLRDDVIAKGAPAPAEPAPAPGAPPTAIFHEMPWEVLTGQPAPATPPK